MILIKKCILKLKSIIFQLFGLIIVLVKSIFNKNKIYLFGTPIHGNIGDQAILIAEEEFLKNNFPNHKLICIESSIVSRFNRIIRRIVGNSTILIQGGGFLGSLWLNEEKMFRRTLEDYPNNTIIVFPQTIYFSNDADGKKQLKKSRKIYSSHHHLYICCREEYSYLFMKKEFPKCNLLLIPDMVLYLEKIKENIERKNVLFCIRRDKEKLNHNFDNILNYFIKEGYEVDYTDTVINRDIFGFNKKRILKQKLNQFSKYKIVITDRLHGMIFSLLANTPCLVFENKSYKIKGVYKWISELKYIKLIDSMPTEKDIEKIVNDESRLITNFNIRELYKPLVKIIKDNL